MPKRHLIWIAAIVATALVTVRVSRPPVPVGDTAGQELGPLAEVYRLIQDTSLLPAKEGNLIAGAAGGMAGAVDEYTTYIPNDKVDAFARRMQGRERGFGLKLEVIDGLARVRRVIFDSPAYRAGLKAGDIVLGVDGNSLQRLSPGGVEDLLWDGPAGQSLRLEILGGDDKPRTVAMERQEIPVESVQGLYRDASGRWVCTLDPNARLAYFRIREFVPRTAEEFQEAFRRVDGVGGVVLDLRGNPGGWLPAAVDVADLFLSQGTIVTVVSRTQPPRQYVARPEGTYPANIPMVVLIDARTASGAEIVAGALGEGKRAALVGVRTRGKGYVQSMVRLPGDLGQINLTTSECLLGEDIPISPRPGSEKWGIDPHLEVAADAAAWEPLAMLRAKAELPCVSPVDTPSERGTPPATTTAAAPLGMADSLLAVDVQLARAVELLKSPEELGELLRGRPGQGDQASDQAGGGSSRATAPRPASRK